MEYIYFDNAATTPQLSEVSKVMIDFAEKNFYNSHALYVPSLLVKAEIERAKRVILQNIDPNESGEIIFTSGATESNNMVILGVNPHKNLIVINDEHASVQKPLKVRGNGGILGAFGKSGEHIHFDATQIFCKLPFFVDDKINGKRIDSVSISAHKIGGPKGIGALWIRKGITLKPLMYGGGLEARAGTENTPAIIGFARAVELWDTEKNLEYVSGLNDYLVKNLPNGCVPIQNTNPYIVTINIPINGQIVMNAMEKEGILVGIGSACSSKDNVEKRQIRISFSPKNTQNEVKIMLKSLENALKNIQK